MFVHVAEEVENNHASLIADWEQLTQDPSAKITYPTIQQLGKKHGVCGSKWLFTGLDTKAIYFCLLFLCKNCYF